MILLNLLNRGGGREVHDGSGALARINPNGSWWGDSLSASDGMI